MTCSELPNQLQNKKVSSFGDLKGGGSLANFQNLS